MPNSAELTTEDTESTEDEIYFFQSSVTQKQATETFMQPKNYALILQAGVGASKVVVF